MIALIWIIFLQIQLPTLPPIESPTPVPTLTATAISEFGDGIWLPSPTPIFTATPIPTGEFDGEIDSNEILTFMATASFNVNALPDDLSEVNGVSFLPDDSPSLLFGYAKWIFSPASAEELLGRTLAPFAINLFIYLAIVVALATVWFLIWLIYTVVSFIMGWWIKHAILGTIWQVLRFFFPFLPL